MRLRAAVCAACVLGAAADAASQTARRPGERVEVAGGIWRVGPSPFGRVDADQTTPDGGTTALFTTRTELEAALAAEGRVGIPLTHALQVEASIKYGTSDLSARITSDVEGIPEVIASEPVKQIAIEGAVVFRIGEPRAGSFAPFLSAGGGYLRELYERQTLAETGYLYHAGGGVMYTFAAPARGALKAVGLRLDARALVRRAGIAFDDDPVVVPAMGASLFMRF